MPNTKYVALLRGIGPLNPNMKGEKLKALFLGLGFKNVKTVIASGNVVFESRSKNATLLEEKIEKELPKKLGFNSTTIIRDYAEFKALAKKDPFKGVIDEKPNYLVVTFFKDRRSELSTVLKTGTSDTTVNFMSKLERIHGKAITTRTWKTVNRIIKKMEKVY